MWNNIYIESCVKDKGNKQLKLAEKLYGLWVKQMTKLKRILADDKNQFEKEDFLEIDFWILLIFFY